MARSISRRRFLKLAGGSLAVFCLSGCSRPAGLTPPPSPSPPLAATDTPISELSNSRTLKIHLYGDIQNLDPAFRISNNDEVVADCVMEGLVRYGPNSYGLVNQVVEWVEQSADGLVVDFALKQGIQWHKGYGELTTADVKFSFERIADPATDAAYADDWATLDHVEIVDRYRGRIVLSEPFAPLWSTTLPVTSGNVICKRYVEEVGLERFATDIVGTGPYVFHEWRPKEAVVLKRNPDYHGQAPYWDEIRFIPIEDDKAAEVALEAGALDFARISIPSVDRFEGHPRLQVWKRPSLRYRWIGMNVQHPKLQDINVRQAIRYGIDVPGILSTCYLGQAEQEFALIPPELIGFWEDAPRYERDVERARAYLSKAGLETLDLKFELQDTTEYRTWAEVARQNLKEIGITLRVRPMEASEFWRIGSGERGAEVELFANNYTMMPDPSWATMWFTCDQIGVWNWLCWCDQAYDRLHRQALVTTDPDERRKVYIEMQRIWDKACHSVWITHGVMVYGYSPRVRPATTPHGVPQPQWFLPA